MRTVSSILREIDQIGKSGLDASVKQLLVDDLHGQLMAAAAQLRLKLEGQAATLAAAPKPAKG